MVNKVLFFMLLCSNLCAQRPYCAGGYIITLPAGDNLTGPVAVAVDGGTIVPAVSPSMPCIGILLDTVSTDTPVQLHTSGTIVNYPRELTPGAVYYLSTTTGAITSTRPSLNWQEVGLAIDTHVLQLNIGRLITDAPQVTIKKNDETAASDAAMSDDSDLFVALESGATYRITGSVFFTAAGASGFKFETTYSGTTSSVVSRHKAQHTGGAEQAQVVTTSLIGETSHTGGTGAGCVEFEIVMTTSTSGTFRFRWSQRNSDADALTVKGGSILTVQKM